MAPQALRRVFGRIAQDAFASETPGNRIPFGGKVYAISYYAIYCERCTEPDLVAFTP